MTSATLSENSVLDILMLFVPALSAAIPTENARRTRRCLETVSRVTRELLEEKKRQVQEEGLEDEKRDLLSLLGQSQRSPSALFGSACPDNGNCDKSRPIWTLPFL
jgi:hypothetical protein